MKPNSSIFMCAEEICRKTFASLNSLKKHVAVIHGDETTNDRGDFSFKCDFEGCQKEFFRSKQLYDHKYNSHKTGKVYACDKCTLSYPTPSKLKRHMKQHDGYPCPITGCSTLSKTVRERQKHFSDCHQKIQPFVCEKCNMKTFSDAKCLKRHLAMHQNYIKCTEIGCSTEFLPKFLRKHMKDFHSDKIPQDGRQNSEELPYSCDQCQKRFGKTVFLKRHIQRIHLVSNTNQKSLKKFSCPSESCQRTFISQIKWESHINWHNNEKPYKCLISGCERCFSGKLSLQKHLRQIHLTTLKRISVLNELIDATNMLETVPAESSSKNI